jgi:site-specific recombinase XerD
VCQNTSMTNSSPKQVPDLASLLASWQLAMRAERKAPGTIKVYSDGVTAFLRWCAATGTPAELTKIKVQAFLADLSKRGAEAATAHARHKGVKRFSAWLAAEGELDTDPLLGSKAPKLDSKITSALSDEQLKALIQACQGRSLKDRRDEAIVRLMAETGMRAGEVIALQVRDVDLAAGSATVHRGKGGKGRTVPFGPHAAAAIDRYMRVRRQERIPDTGPLWVGVGGRTFGYHGMHEALKARAQKARIEGFHLHLLRHTFATRWKAAQGSDDGLMAVAGWSSRAMIDRYSGAAAAQRAAAESRRLGLGDL